MEQGGRYEDLMTKLCTRSQTRRGIGKTEGAGCRQKMDCEGLSRVVAANGNHDKDIQSSNF